MKGTATIVILLTAAAAGALASFVWGDSLKPLVGCLLMAFGILQFTPLMFRTEDGGRLPVQAWSKWFGGALIFQGLAQLVPEGTAFWTTMSIAMVLLAGAFYQLHKRRAAV